MRKLLFILFLAVAVIGSGRAVTQERITVFAAASLKEAMDRAADAFKAQSGKEVVVSFAASSVLARQIGAGAPADIFISADRDWMEWLADRDLLREESRRLLAGNELVIATAHQPAAGAGPQTILAEGRFAMGDPTHVPAGRYARAALTSLGLWDKLKRRAVFGENVRVALELAQRGDVAAAIVYGSDLMAATGLSLAYAFPPGSHPPIVYPMAETLRATPAAEAFLAFLSGQAGQAIFQELGFAQPPL